MSLNIQNISKSYGNRDLLSSFSLEIQSGVRLCVCGPNGSGKSTLLRILAGTEAPDAGTISVPRGARLGYVEQELDESALSHPLLSFVMQALPDWSEFWADWEEAVGTTANPAPALADPPADAGVLARLAARQHELELKYGYNPEHLAKTALTGLGLGEAKWGLSLKNLSGGMRERAKLARVLSAGADILLLDEPTNHLDLEAVEWLETFLQDYRGVLVFVAHDRIFMDKVGNHLLYLSGKGKAVFRKGNFSKFLEVQEELEESRAREAARVQDEINHKLEFVRRFKAKASKARQAASRQRAARKLEKELDGLKAAPRRRELRFAWPEPQESDRTVLSVSDLRFAFPDGKRLWEKLSFNIYRGQKIGLAGPNGCGKSSLLRLLTGHLERESGQILMGQHVKFGYFSQHRLESLNPRGTVLGEIRRLSDPRTTEEELMSVLGLFLLGSEFFERSVSSLSGGEKSRLALAGLFLGRANFLILDEPTNHLDLESREALVEALSSYTGTLLMVAHDRYLLSEAADQIWALSTQGFNIFSDGFEEYAAYRREKTREDNARAAEQRRLEISRVSGLGREEQKIKKRREAEERKARAKALKPLLDLHSRLEADLEKTLTRQSETEAVLARPESFTDSAQSSALLREFHSLRSKAEDLFEQLAASEAEIAALNADNADKDDENAAD
ncbi:MAG: ATP-binding cassette domain-containing protein [Desulfovibrio sp.]|jgi:ATP-binding cassette subfamily F protein 3|nr:ATP-binding cassette domain-containing protein [Desulfovibrio sp.]